MLFRSIRRLFGHDIYSVGAGGELRLDRRRIACEVFADPDKLRMLNDVVHPAVFEAFRLMCEKARHEDTAVLVKEAAILFEAGRADELDLVAVVVAADEIRVKRAVERGVGSREEILRRMALQWPQERLIELAGYVLWNEGSLDRLRQETEKLHAFILERAGELSGNCR